MSMLFGTKPRFCFLASKASFSSGVCSTGSGAMRGEGFAPFSMAFSSGRRWRWRTFHAAIRAEHTAVAGLRAQRGLAAGAFIEELARVCRHAFRLRGAAARAGDGRFENGHCGFAPPSPELGRAGGDEAGESGVDQRFGARPV